ncbi:MAG: hypothetical protein AAFR83_27400 [Cyanobacteria bacterium J06629_18]
MKQLFSLTVEQAIKSVEICQNLSDLHQDIVLFRFDDLKGEIYILAGLDIEIVRQRGLEGFPHERLPNPKGDLR